MEIQRILFTTNAAEALSEALRLTDHDRLFVLTDAVTAQLCWPLVSEICREEQLVTIPAGDDHKTTDSLIHVWQSLSSGGASRRSLMVNIGGGMVTDLGGFAASTFKRGIRFINIPTTLLSMVDASVGGKTGINLGGLKNEVGTFRNAEEVIIDTHFLRTLDADNLRSGYAEMLKHALISRREDWAELLRFDILRPDFGVLQTLVEKSVEVKRRVVTEDPEEHGIRKSLNLGHTVGHAFESLSLRTGHPVLHGYAVAWGLVCELYLSCKRTAFPHDVMLQTAAFIKETYGTYSFDCKRYEELYELMTHDKKNANGIINFSLLSDIGQVCLNQAATKEEIFDMLDFYRETMGA